jgi:hypothetical protein
MPRPTETALKGRARALLAAMTERARWIYAVPRDEGEKVQPILEAAGLVCEERDPAAGVARFGVAPRPSPPAPSPSQGEGVKASFVIFDSSELEVMLLEAAGDDAPPILAKVLDRTGFYAQSQLIGTALDVRDPEASKSLRTLAHMVVGWDEDWSDLFLLHLAAPDPIVRHEAALALSVAAMVARETGPAIAPLEEARRRETFPKLKETIGEAIALLTASSGGPVEVSPEAPPTPAGTPPRGR